MSAVSVHGSEPKRPDAGPIGNEWSMAMAAQVTVEIPAALRMHSGGADVLTVTAGTAREAFAAMRTQHAALVQHVLTRDGALRPYVKLFVRNSDVRDLRGLDTVLGDGDVLTIVPSVAGG